MFKALLSFLGVPKISLFLCSQLLHSVMQAVFSYDQQMCSVYEAYFEYDLVN